jgi:hypothetical protein
VTALAKVPAVVSHLESLLEAGEKVVCFAHHRDVIAQIMEAIPQSVCLTGGMEIEERQAAVDRFQTDDDCRLFVGSITAAGVGITLTASSSVVFAELDWVPGNISQAEDRCHRIGQTESVLVQHIVLEDSLDAKLAQTIVSKQRVIDQALDVEPPKPPEPPKFPVYAPQPPKPKSALEELAERLTTDQKEAAHEAVRFLAGLCDGATTYDHAGFNKLDTQIGHDFARKEKLNFLQSAIAWRIARRYRNTQLPAELAERIGE